MFWLSICFNTGKGWSFISLITFLTFSEYSFALAVGQLRRIGDTEPLAMRPPQMLLLHSYFHANLSASSVIHPRKAL